ncbi:hypothetical protein FB451DRAFT_1151054 [Mycena latifolia]|nr:hypothetical protein FB451DRAFT_1151054 [Mycena latifolia]
MVVDSGMCAPVPSPAGESNSNCIRNSSAGPGIEPRCTPWRHGVDILLEVTNHLTTVVKWLVRLPTAERDKREGRACDDRFAIGVMHLCRFYTPLIKLWIFDPGNDADSAVMAQSGLRNARFAEANTLYRHLVGAREM